jgi:hypothetical protein
MKIVDAQIHIWSSGTPVAGAGGARRLESNRSQGPPCHQLGWLSIIIFRHTAQLPPGQSKGLMDRW